MSNCELGGAVSLREGLKKQLVEFLTKGGGAGLVNFPLIKIIV